MLLSLLIPKFVKRRIEIAKKRTLEQVHSARDVAFRGGVVTLISAVIIWLAIFLYIAFYYAYMPSIAHVRPVHLQFKSCDESKGICSYPTAHVQLTKRQNILMVGQPYKMYLHLDMPESPANRELGMFMVCIQLHDKDHTLVSNSCRSTMLHYRSFLVHILSTLAFSPFMIFGTSEEKQNIVLELYTDFEEDQNHPVTDIYVEIQSRHVELYSAMLYIHAHFTGLRYLMFHWPMLSAIVGISSNLFFIVLICLLSWLRIYQMSDDDSSSYISQEDASEKKEAIFFKGDCEDSSSEDVSIIQEDNQESLLQTQSRDFISEISKQDISKQ